MTNTPNTKPEDLPPMEYRYLGNSGLKVSAISLGGWLTYGGHVDNESTFACLKAAYDSGINFFDCAEGYAGGESETQMGAAIKQYAWKRNDLVISTKIYWGGANGNNNINNSGLSRKHIVEGLKLSLERLGLGYVDLVYAHRPDRNVPMLETVRAFNWVIEKGWAFYWGTSDWTAEEISRATELAERYNLIPPLMEQPQYNMLIREKVEREFWPLYRSYKLGLTIFSPLKGGVLTGKYDEGVPDDSRIAKSDDGYIQGLKKTVGGDEWVGMIEKVKKLKPIAERLGTDRAGLAMAWVLKNQNVSSAITGASRPEQVYKSVRALEVVPKLTDELMKEIEEVLGNKPEAWPMQFY